MGGSHSTPQSVSNHRRPPVQSGNSDRKSSAKRKSWNKKSSKKSLQKQQIERRNSVSGSAPVNFHSPEKISSAQSDTCIRDEDSNLNSTICNDGFSANYSVDSASVTIRKSGIKRRATLRSSTSAITNNPTVTPVGPLVLPNSIGGSGSRPGSVTEIPTTFKTTVREFDAADTLSMRSISAVSNTNQEMNPPRYTTSTFQNGPRANSSSFNSLSSNSMSKASNNNNRPVSPLLVNHYNQQTPVMRHVPVLQHNDQNNARWSCQSMESGITDTSFSSSMDYDSTSNTHIHIGEMLEAGVEDSEIIRTWLEELGLSDYLNAFLEAGYDMPTITRMTTEDLTAIGVTKPAHRKRLKMELTKIHNTVGALIENCYADGFPESVYDLLSQLRLQEYFGVLSRHGCDSVPKLMNLDWEDFEDVGVKKLGHQKKLLLAVKHFNLLKRQSRAMSLGGLCLTSSRMSNSSVDGLKNNKMPPPPLTRSNKTRLGSPPKLSTFKENAVQASPVRKSFAASSIAASFIRNGGMQNRSTPEPYTQHRISPLNDQTRNQSRQSNGSLPMYQTNESYESNFAQEILQRAGKYCSTQDYSSPTTAAMIDTPPPMAPLESFSRSSHVIASGHATLSRSAGFAYKNGLLKLFSQNNNTSQNIQRDLPKTLPEAEEEQLCMSMPPPPPPPQRNETGTTQDSSFPPPPSPLILRKVFPNPTPNLSPSDAPSSFGTSSPIDPTRTGSTDSGNSSASSVTDEHELNQPKAVAVVKPGDVLNEISGMLENLTDELDSMLKYDEAKSIASS